MISNEKVLFKIKEQLEEAMKSVHDEQKMLRHISNIKLLTELFIDEHENERKDSETEQPSLKTSQVSNTPNVSPNVVDQDGTSIFDF